MNSIHPSSPNLLPFGRGWLNEGPMFETAWLTLRQAQEALKNGRLEDAQRLLGRPVVQGHARSWDLLRQLAEGLVARGEAHWQREEPAAAWNDLLLAEQVGSAPAAARLRQALTRAGLAEARECLEAGDPARAGEVLAQLRQRGVEQPDAVHLAEAAAAWVRAREQAGRGDFAQAQQAVELAQRRLSRPVAVLDEFGRELAKKRESFTAMLLRLHDAVDRTQWREVIQVTDDILAAAPQHEAARKARSRAWKAIEPVTATLNLPRPAQPASPAPAETKQAGQRYVLWIDGVGGYLICLGNRVTIGQACPENDVDVPLFADVSRLHAALTRDNEGYLLEAYRPTQVNGQVRDKVFLQKGDRLTFGPNCQFQFAQPVPVSGTARLDLQSGHRLSVAVAGVILMADTLVLGNGPQVHVAMPDLETPVILYRHPKGLGVRHAGNLVVDGERCAERGMLNARSIVNGDTFALALEPFEGGWARG